MLRSKIENAHWTEKKTTTRCCIRETVITRNVVLWLFSNNHNALWHLKIYRDAKVVAWLLKGMLSSKIENSQWAEKTTTTRCGI